MNTPTEKKIVRELKGTVASTKMQKTVVVVVNRYVKHPKYKKFQNIHKRYKAHDADGICKEGDVVYIRESRPISKHTHFVVVRKAESAPVREAAE